MNNIDINKENGIKTIRKFYSAVNELIDILNRDVNEGGYNKEKLEKKIQAYVNYFGDTKKWEELTKGTNNDKDKDLLFDKVQDDVSDIVSLSTSKEDANNARKALRQLSDVTSTDVMDVLKSCIDDGGKVGKYTRYAKKKLIMNNVPSIYEKEETNNGTDLYYNVVHGKYQILHGDKIYTTKRGSAEKKQEPNLEQVGEIGNVGDATTEQMGETTNANTIKDDEVGRKSGEAEGVEKPIEQPEKTDTMGESLKKGNKQLEGEIEWSKEKIIDELKKIQNMDGYQELKRCNDVEFSFLAQQLLRSPEAVDLLKRISMSERNEGDKERINGEFKSMLDTLLANFVVNIKYFRDGDINKELTGRKSFRIVKSNFEKQLGVNSEDIENLKNISEYMAFISCINNIKNSVIDANKKIRGTGKGSLVYLLKGKNDVESYSIIEEHLIKLLLEKKEEFEGLKEQVSSKKMEELKEAIELDFNSLIYKNNRGKYVLTKAVQNEVAPLIRNISNDNGVDSLMYLFLPVFIKMGVFAKNNSIFSHHWFNYIDISNFKSGGNVANSVIKYVINGKTIELNIGKLKDFESKYNPLTHYYFDFKNVVLYAIYKTIKGNSNCPYGVELELEENNKSTFLVYDVVSKGGQFFEDSHYGECLEKVFEEDDIDIQLNSGDANESSVVQERDAAAGGDEVREIQDDGEKITESIEPSSEDSTKPVEEGNTEGKGENDKVKSGEKVESKQKAEKKKRGNKAIERKENSENITIEDIIDFYVSNKVEREKLKKMKKNNTRDQMDYPKQRENYKIKVTKPGFEKGISFGLGVIVEKIGKKIGKKINKPYSEPGFKTLLIELKNLILEKLRTKMDLLTNDGKFEDAAAIRGRIEELERE